jgi:prophage antirepressor-like protein
MGIIPERELYRLIMNSRLETAGGFKDWMVGKIQEERDEDELVLKDIFTLQRKLEEKDRLLKARQNPRLS